ncbi:MAG: protein phosphatase 2C domain-containing protein, partial [Desulfobacterales bacterium]|nr:protein phosphatase 2C domain-containing protein [Desulfobacterales bacterium]
SPVTYGILSDGCSSSEQTDVGARILAHLASAYLIRHQDNLESIAYEPMGKTIIESAGQIAELMNLPKTALDATLIIAYELNRQIYIYVYGDGCILYKKSDQPLSITTISFLKNAPYYLSYQLDQARNQSYLDCQLTKQVGDQIVAVHTPVQFIFPMEQDAAVMISSDGIESFIDNYGNKIHVNEAASEFMSFKNVKGSFVKRRIKRAIRDYEKSGRVHYDDISLAAFLMS